MDDEARIETLKNQLLNPSLSQAEIDRIEHKLELLGASSTK